MMKVDDRGRTCAGRAQKVDAVQIRNDVLTFLIGVPLVFIALVAFFQGA